MKMEVEELEDLLRPDDVDVDFRRFLEEARDEGGRKIFETFSSDGLSNFLVAEWSRWDKYKRAPWRHLCWVQKIRMWISDTSWKKHGTQKGCAMLKTLSTDGTSKFVVVSRSR